MTDFSKDRERQWAPGEVRTYSKSDSPTRRLPERHEPVVPGLFWYSGFGLGTFYSPDGWAYWHVRSEAVAHAKQDGVEFIFRDSFADYGGVSVQD